MSSRLSLCIYAPSEQLTQSWLEALSRECYRLNFVDSPDQLFDFVKANKEKIDCLIVVREPRLLPIFNQLYESGTLLPTLIIEQIETISPEMVQTQPLSPTHLYHSAEINLIPAKITDIVAFIDEAIAHFLNLGPSSPIGDALAKNHHRETKGDNHSFLLLQQRRLAEKLKERLGYLGVYYSRNSQLFYRNLPNPEKEELINLLNQEYRQIILYYFSDDTKTNKLIDQFVNRIFFVDISVSKILEIHMKLMDEFAQQLKLEGRNEEILLDYRLALIDIIAHLCEMYRRSIPREDIPFKTP
ncbi:circadian clock protein KaiA [Gloeocapsa sp. PCC 73106]|uniref:circadian clock protein KaiA n=1 Tax=Gloeocapsa sp. PCC 73106 TaxID=102232 RepID=UPI0002ACAC92|nr:circadian clock protein KaiA [Gloeocapsa sp. PCC 73106]ELR98167.1 KaiA domain protein [Gloeocapsa sp. PCC 73106]